MNHHALVLLSLLFLAVPAVALASDGADTAVTDLEAPAVEAPAACSDSAGLADTIQVGFTSLAVCTAAAECAPFPDIDCEGDSNCSVADRNCSTGQRGFVTCDGSTTYCGGPCCASDGTCEYSYGCGCSDPDCEGTKFCPECPSSCTMGCSSEICSAVTNCVTNDDCCNPGSICGFNGICLCT